LYGDPSLLLLDKKIQSERKSPLSPGTYTLAVQKKFFEEEREPSYVKSTSLEMCDFICMPNN
jgi:hypothetical protein